MKVKITILMAVFLSLTIIGAALAEEIKIGYVSLPGIFDAYKKVADSNSKLEVQKKAARDMIENIRKLQEGFDTLNQEGKEERKNQILAKQEEVRKKTFEIKKEEDKILREILDDIEKVSQDLRKKKKLTYIIDGRLVIDAPKEMDLTNEVVEVLNKSYKGQ